MIERKLEKIILDRMFQNKAIIVLGARQTGKTTLLRQITGKLNQPVLWLDADEPFVRSQLTNVNIPDLKLLIGNNKIVVVDEAQQVRNVGQTLKLITDHISDVQLLVSGSSSLEITAQTSEPLTGRKFEFFLYPLSFQEMLEHHGWLEEKKLLDQRLVYGSYPDIAATKGNPGELLSLLAGSYLYKDIFKFKDLRRPELLEALLQALALQMGSQVSYNELGKSIGADSETVQRYIDLLEKTFVIFRLRSFSRNIRNELKKSRKVYFYDNGIRNALINNYSPIEMRSDKGALWENYLVNERLKFLTYSRISVNRYFWRTQQQQEIDYIEERDGLLHAYEFKWKAKPGLRVPPVFSKAYPEHTFRTVSPGDFDSFLTQI
ncbi:MAG TPA: ATP-binding protein [Bacteroidales bacterium]|nr:ATP-binding protein [Bacteroidales bacterium]